MLPEEARAMSALDPKRGSWEAHYSISIIVERILPWEKFLADLPFIWEETNRSVRLMRTRSRSGLSFS